VSVQIKNEPTQVCFWCIAGKFWGFIVHEKGIEIDPKKIEVIRNVKAPNYIKDLQKYLGNVNYLRRFICNLSGKVNVFTPLLRLEMILTSLRGQSNMRHLMRLKTI
jgi:hypothetical protein